jgi:hypothetical protein
VSGARRRGWWLGAALTALAARAWDLLPLPLWSCPLRALTGVPCPTCYLTRSVLATFRGDLAGALRWHAFGPPLVLTGAALAWHQLVRGRPIDPIRLAKAGMAAAVLGISYWIVRLLHPALLP